MSTLLRRTALVLLPLALTACDTGEAPPPDPDLAAAPLAFVSATPPVTEAPDLVSVDNFRPGPLDDDGLMQTLVDYTFDQAAYLNGGDRSSFSLIPLDAGDAFNARGTTPDADLAEGDEIVTVLFAGTVSPTDYARGFVATGVVNSACCNVGPDNPANINQSAIVGADGFTENPDLIRVTTDGKSKAIFEFDEPLTDDDVVQSTSGLRVFFPTTDQNGTIRNAGAIKVKAISPTELKATFPKDLPEGFTLADAVGAYVVQGAVQAAVGSRGGNDGKNAFDEVPITAN